MTHPFTFQRFYKDVTALPRLIGSEPGNKGFGAARVGFENDIEAAVGETGSDGRFPVRIGVGNGE